ncbi:TetR/AcrR family transcriptional regulator [Nocardia sp. CDC160]|uniref:TetR/AcrR family transcriptional regulator n=1 Tax=Nocardia sp. CDC160 TaxID=3112166 RepID=UPI002DBA93FF|nr:TetR family transcriptional regulator [Nocardia sp. CDC160]MEC3915618.1 TetR family transcriptional regulator [Nocardia sp. CDC160]
MADQAPKRRRRDPERRREEILSAAEEVLLERGVAGLTHRAVAEKTGVTLGATTYYFKTLDDIMRAVLQRVADRFAAYLDAFHEAGEFTGLGDFVPALAQALVESYTAGRDLTAMECDLLFAAMRRPELRPIADQLTRATAAAIARYTDPLTARTAAALAMGITIQGMTTPDPPDVTEVTTMLERLLGTERTA